MALCNYTSQQDRHSQMECSTLIEHQIKKFQYILSLSHTHKHTLFDYFENWTILGTGAFEIH